MLVHSLLQSIERRRVKYPLHSPSILVSAPSKFVFSITFIPGTSRGELTATPRKLGQIRIFVSFWPVGCISRVARNNIDSLSVKRSQQQYMPCFRPGSNRGPSACKADVITTTPRKPWEDHNFVGLYQSRTTEYKATE